MLHFSRLLTLISLSVLLVSGCVPIVLPAPKPAAAEAGELTLEPLFRLVVDLEQPKNIGSGQLGIRYISLFTGGAVTGPKLLARC